MQSGVTASRAASQFNVVPVDFYSIWLRHLIPDWCQRLERIRFIQMNMFNNTIHKKQFRTIEQ